MQSKPGLPAALFLIALLLFQPFAPALQAQGAPQPPPPPTPQELDQLLAPIALYPDSLLAQITTASTNPQEILDVDNWLAQNPNLSGTALTDAAQQQGFDPAFIALVNFPTVLQMMAENIDDYAAIGTAVSSNQAEVSEAIQRLRSQAYAAGTLRSTPQQQVQVDQSDGQTIYAIQPTNPQVVYVPQYNPTVVYTGPSTGAIVATSLITFGVGIGIGALLVSNQPWGWGGWGWNWGRRSIYYNRGPWGGWHGGYRPPNYWYRPRPVSYPHRPGYGGNWGYRPPNYRPPYGGRPPHYNRPVNRPGYRPPTIQPAPGHRPGNGNRPGQPVGRPGYNRPGNGNRPGQPVGRPGNGSGNRPPSNPGYNRPSTRPVNGNRPTIQPVKPGTPAGQPNRPPAARPNQQRPTAQHKPPQNRPTSQQQPRGGDRQAR